VQGRRYSRGWRRRRKKGHELVGGVRHCAGQEIQQGVAEEEEQCHELVGGAGDTGVRKGEEECEPVGVSDNTKLPQPMV
jgi:hypothetical protein